MKIYLDSVITRKLSENIRYTSETIYIGNKISIRNKYIYQNIYIRKKYILYISEIKNIRKPSEKYHITPIRLAKILSLHITKYQRVYESMKMFIYSWMNHKMDHFFRKQIGLT